MSEAGKGETGVRTKNRSRRGEDDEAGREKEGEAETGVMVLGMYFSENPFILIFTCAVFRFRCWRRVQERGDWVLN